MNLLKLKAGMLYDLETGLTRFEIHISLVILLLMVFIMLVLNRFVFKQNILVRSDSNEVGNQDLLFIDEDPE